MAMSAMVERVARAMCANDGFDPDENAMRDRYVSNAYAAIRAMRVPTTIMLIRGSDQIGKPKTLPEAWQAMIDAALKEGT